MTNVVPLSPAEIHFKLCRKVAQLTRVIFQLNIKNEESETWVKEATEHSEKQLEAVVQASNAKVAKLQEATAAAATREKILGTELAQLKARAHAEAEKFRLEFNLVSSKVEKLESLLNCALEEKASLVAQKNLEISKLRGDLDASTASTGKLSSDIIHLKNQHSRDILISEALISKLTKEVDMMREDAVVSINEIETARAEATAALAAAASAPAALLVLLLLMLLLGLSRVGPLPRPVPHTGRPP